MMTTVDPESKTIKLIKEVISDSDKKQFMWQDIIGAVTKLSDKRTAEREQLFANLLEFKGSIRLLPGSDITSVMSPEDSLQSIAIQNLTKWNGQKYLPALEKLRATTDSEAIAEVAQIHIVKIRAQQQEPKNFINVIFKAFSRFINLIFRIRK